MNQLLESTPKKHPKTGENTRLSQAPTIAKIGCLWAGVRDAGASKSKRYAPISIACRARGRPLECVSGENPTLGNSGPTSGGGGACRSLLSSCFSGVR